MLFFLLLSVSLASVYLNEATIWIEIVGNITYMPSSCVLDCRNRCLKCNLTSVDCTFTDFLSLQGKGPMVKFYSRRPSNVPACQRETLTISKYGLYRLTIDSYAKNYRFFVSHTEDFTEKTIAVNFVLGYVISY